MKKWIFGISIFLNVIFILFFAWNWLNSPTNELGRLEKEIEIGYFLSDSSVFKIPKGLTVKNMSERGLGAIGQFENERFSIVITSNDASLVNYNLPKDSLDMFGNFYSAELPQNKKQEDSREVVKIFAEQYAPHKSENLNTIPKDMVIAFSELRKTDKEAHTKYLTLVFAKLYAEHLRCCHQGYIIAERHNNDFDKKNTSMVNEFTHMTNYINYDNLPEFWSSGIIEKWLNENPKLLEFEPIEKQKQIIDSISNKIANGDYWNNKK